MTMARQLEAKAMDYNQRSLNINSCTSLIFLISLTDLKQPMQCITECPIVLLKNEEDRQAF